MSLSLAACQSTEAEVASSEPKVTRVTAEDLRYLDPAARLALSISDQHEVLLFDPSLGALDFGRIELICPNGQQMMMDVWLVELAQSQGLDLETYTRGEFTLARNQSDALEAINGRSVSPGMPSPEPLAKAGWKCCGQECSCCDDGVCSCYCTLYVLNDMPCPE
jgi:hypothetical protein